MNTDDRKKLIRQIVNFIWQYATSEHLTKIAEMIGLRKPTIKAETK